MSRESRRKFKGLLAVAIGASLVGALPSAAAGQAGYGPPAALITSQSGKQTPDTKFFDREGRSHDLREFEGKITIVNLWASWCAPCRAEMPALERLARAYPDDVQVLAISQDRRGWQAVDGFWNDGYRRIAVYLSPDDELARGLGAIGLPFTVMFDRNGREIGRLPRAGEWDSGRLRAAVDRAVKAR